MKKRKDGRYRVIVDGKPVYAYSEREMHRKLKDLQYEKEQGPLFEEVAEEWENLHRKTVEPTSFDRGYAPALKRALEQFSGIRINKIRPIDVDSFLKANTHFSKKTLSNQKLVLNMIFDRAVLSGNIEYNPCASVKLPKNLKQSFRTLPSDIDIAVIKQHYIGFDLIPYFLIYTGLRRSELLALTYEDIDFENNTISINKVITYEGNSPKLRQKTKTASSNRNVLLLDILKDKIPHG